MSLNENLCGAFQVIVFDFQPVNPESIDAAISILSGKSVPGSYSQTIISNVIYDLDSFFFGFQRIFWFMTSCRNLESVVKILTEVFWFVGVVMQRKLKNVPKQRCWMVGSSKGNNAMEMAIEFNSSWETDLRVGLHDCRHYTNGTITSFDFALFSL